MKTAQTDTRGSHAKPHYQPDEFSAVTTFLMLERADECIDFMKRVFDAQEAFSLRTDKDELQHAQIRIGDASIMVADVMGMKDHVMPAALYVYVKDADATYKKALAAGAKSILEPADQFYGDRNAGVRDVHGNIWWIATKIEDLSPAELKKRGKEYAEQCAQKDKPSWQRPH